MHLNPPATLSKLTALVFLLALSTQTVFCQERNWLELRDQGRNALADEKPKEAASLFMKSFDEAMKGDAKDDNPDLRQLIYKDMQEATTASLLGEESEVGKLLVHQSQVEIYKHVCSDVEQKFGKASPLAFLSYILLSGVVSKASVNPDPDRKKHLASINMKLKWIRENTPPADKERTGQYYREYMSYLVERVNQQKEKYDAAVKNAKRAIENLTKSLEAAKKETDSK